MKINLRKPTEDLQDDLIELRERRENVISSLEIFKTSNLHKNLFFPGVMGLTGAGLVGASEATQGQLSSDLQFTGIMLLVIAALATAMVLLIPKHAEASKETLEKQINSIEAELDRRGAEVPSEHEEYQQLPTHRQ